MLALINIAVVIGYKIYEKWNQKEVNGLKFELSEKSTYGDAKLLNDTPKKKK